VAAPRLRRRRQAAGVSSAAVAGGAPAADGERLVVALVRGVHGLRGAVRLEILTDDPRRFARGSRLYREGSPDAFTVAWSRRTGPGFLVRFLEVPDRAAAEALRDAYLEGVVEASALPAGSFYWHEVIGTEVRTLDGEVLGVVEDVFRVGEGEVFEVRGGPRGEILVPGVSTVIREFEPREGRIVVDREALGLDRELPQPRPRGRLTTRSRRRGGAVPEGPPLLESSDASRVPDPSSPDAGPALDRPPAPEQPA
jgi:16S rRNA processing protein RimM